MAIHGHVFPGKTKIYLLPDDYTSLTKSEMQTLLSAPRESTTLFFIVNLPCLSHFIS